MNRRFLRRSDASALFESFLIAAVASFLAIRFLLEITGYPQLGGSGLHIAHMLPGGLLMLAALMLLLAYLDRSIHHVAALIGGFGFGAFIDEIGKFLTADNDYFFRPAVALIYIVFVLLYLVGRALAGGQKLTPTESLANAMDALEGMLGRAVEPEDRARIRQLLDAADAESELVRDLRRYLEGLPSTADIYSPHERVQRRLADGYRRLVENDWFERAVVIAVVGYAVAAVVGIYSISVALGDQKAPMVATAQQASSVVGGLLILRGVISLPRSRAAAYVWFTRGLLVWMLISQVFVFYSSQLAGLVGLAIDLLAYGALRFALSNEAASRGPAGTRSQDAA
ncbi:MAG: hypothetical protein M3P84_00960 [Chloroflexota bacterium]|nr:hypothetical protein [Chloroflexota bacterium]